MQEFYYISFIHKSQVRFFLRILKKDNILFKISSIYCLNEQKYIILDFLGINTSRYQSYINLINMDNIDDLGLRVLFKWAISEIKYDNDYLRLSQMAKEYKNTETIRGAYLEINGKKIIRLFEQLMDIIYIANASFDSFSNKNNESSYEILFENIESALKQGANIIDIGGQSTSPSAKEINSTEEIVKLERVINYIFTLKNKYTFKISVDTYKNEVVKSLINNYGNNIDIINDVSGRLNCETLRIINEYKLMYITMHSLTVPANKNINIDIKIDPLDVISRWIEKRYAYLTDTIGFLKEQIIFDIGIGFNKLPWQSWYLLNKMQHFQNPKLQLLVGHSRKSFLNTVTIDEFSNRDIESAFIANKLIHVIDYIRIHNVSLYNKIGNCNNNFPIWNLL